MNLWATWCGPCVAELPELVTMNRMYRGRPFQLVTISMDDPAKKDEALRVLKENHVSATNYILSSTDRDKFAEALDQEWPGPVPYTLVIAPGRQGPLPQDRPDRPARAQAGHRRPTSGGRISATGPRPARPRKNGRAAGRAWVVASCARIRWLM